ncbi:MAG: oxidoreductase, partial [Nitrospirae bacterium]|nr:oxidoreductase [Nitrospirota bacterium]
LNTVTREHAGWTGRVGRLDESLLRDFLSNSRTLFYLCGPDRMIDALSGTLKSLGAAEDRIRF